MQNQRLGVPRCTQFCEIIHLMWPRLDLNPLEANLLQDWVYYLLLKCFLHLWACTLKPHISSTAQTGGRDSSTQFVNPSYSPACLWAQLISFKLQHALALFLFIPFSKSINTQFNALLNSRPLTIKEYASYTSIPLPSFITNIKIPRQVFFLVLNSLTQYLCIRGVNILGSISSALTVTIVLNIRKLVSLLLSIWLFGNELHVQVLFGAAVVFGGGFLYGLESQRQNKLRKVNSARTKGKKSQ